MQMNFGNHDCDKNLLITNLFQPLGIHHLVTHGFLFTNCIYEFLNSCILR